LLIAVHAGDEDSDLKRAGWGTSSQGYVKVPGRRVEADI